MISSTAARSSSVHSTASRDLLGVANTIDAHAASHSSSGSTRRKLQIRRSSPWGSRTSDSCRTVRTSAPLSIKRSLNRARRRRKSVAPATVRSGTPSFMIAAWRAMQSNGLRVTCSSRTGAPTMRRSPFSSPGSRPSRSDVFSPDFAPITRSCRTWPCQPLGTAYEYPVARRPAVRVASASERRRSVWKSVRRSRSFPATSPSTLTSCAIAMSGCASSSDPTRLCPERG